MNDINDGIKKALQATNLFEKRMFEQQVLEKLDAIEKNTNELLELVKKITQE